LNLRANHHSTQQLYHQQNLKNIREMTRPIKHHNNRSKLRVNLNLPANLALKCDYLANLKNPTNKSQLPKNLSNLKTMLNNCNLQRRSK